MEHCAHAFTQYGSLFTTFFIGGLAGGFTHCITMCGPLVACQTMCRKTSCSTRTSLLQSLNITYHIGRATTYGILGFISAFLSQQITDSPLWPWIAAGMLVMAGIMFILSSISGCKHPFINNTPKSAYIRGTLLGFLPCGLLYAALMMSATTADPLRGMLAMWYFVLGTVPALVLANLGINVLTRRWKHVMQPIGRVMMIGNGLVLFFMAVQLVR